MAQTEKNLPAVMTIRYEGSKRDADVKNRLLDSVGEGKGGMT